jgi:phosphoribosylglycinamide formyltransferase 1
VHFVAPELDAGPLVLQARVAVQTGDTEQSLAARVLASEHIIYPKVIGWFADGRLALRNGQVWFDGAVLNAPLVEDMRVVAPH